MTSSDELDLVEERRACLLFDRTVVFHLQRGIAVPLGAVEFYAGLAQRFVARGGMYFLPGQVTD